MKSIELISGLEILSKVEAYKIKGGTDNKELPVWLDWNQNSPQDNSISAIDEKDSIQIKRDLRRLTEKIS